MRGTRKRPKCLQKKDHERNLLEKWNYTVQATEQGTEGEK